MEFIGEKVQKNPYKLSFHCFYFHGDFEVKEGKDSVPLGGKDKLIEWFNTREKDHGEIFEGLVIRLKSGHLHKITREHLGMKWN